MGGGDEVGEGVGLLFQLAVEIPAVALGHRAADVGQRIDETAIDEREAGGAEIVRDGEAVSAVAVEQDRRRAVDRRGPVAQDGDGDEFAIGGFGVDALNDVVVRVVAGRDFLLFAQDAGVVGHVVIINLGRRVGRGIVEA